MKIGDFPEALRTILNEVGAFMVGGQKPAQVVYPRIRTIFLHVLAITGFIHHSMLKVIDQCRKL